MVQDISLYCLNVCKWKRYLVHSEPLNEIEVKMCQRTKKECSKYTCSCKSRKIELVLFLLHNKLCNHITKTKQNCKHNQYHIIFNYNLATTPTKIQDAKHNYCKLTHLRMWCFWWSLATFPVEHCTRPWGRSFFGLLVPSLVRTYSHSGSQRLHASQQAPLPSFWMQCTRIWKGADLRDTLP